MQNKNSFNAVKIASVAPNRKKLYQLISKKYDLPNYGPAVTVEYLTEIVKPESRFLKVKREETI